MACFNDMPPEVRNEIYSLVLRKPTTGHAECQPNELALLSVNKKIHAEAASFFYENNTVAVDTEAPFSKTATNLPINANRFVRFIRCLDLNCDIGEATSPATQQTAKIIESLIWVTPNLKELYITLSATTSPFVNSRIDDSIMDATHPIVLAIRAVMYHHPSLVAAVNLWGFSFAAGTGTVQALMEDFPARLDFLVEDSYTADLMELERDLVGQYASDHLMYLDPEYRNASTNNNEQFSFRRNGLSTAVPSISSSITELDTFSVTSFGRSPPTVDDADAKHDSDGKSLVDEDDLVDMEFFSWPDEASVSMEDGGELANMDIDNDLEMESISQEELARIAANMLESEGRMKNEQDVDYLTNFAPHLL